MFNANIMDVRTWRDSIEAIASLIDEGTFRIDKDGMKLRAMNPSQIALVDFELPAKAFENYEVKEPCDMAIDFSKLSKITKRIKPDDKIELKLDSQLKMVFSGKTKRSFSISVLGATAAQPKEPKVDFTAEVKVNAGTLKDALKDAELISNHVAIEINKKQMILSAEGDTESMNVVLPEEDIISIDAKEKARSVFSLEYLDSLLKAADASSVMVLSMRADAPLRVEYAIGGGKVVYYLAPRIESS